MIISNPSSPSLMPYSIGTMDSEAEVVLVIGVVVGEVRS